ncbi:MAG: lysylphosphatidylglycerol synthase domain-containing protein [Planctomycetes bacterium]|nr:lysylphosphatidylglycerol synthase domain-containing protein [Planctomycetota bacterium]
MPDPRNKTAILIVKYLIGLALVLAAAYMALRSIDLSQIPAVQPRMLLFMGMAVTASILLTTALFWCITLSFDADPPVSFPRMLTLIAASGLLNYLPMRPGMVGRGAYLKARHGLPLAQYLLTLIIVLVVTLVVVLITTVSLACSPAWGWAGAASGLVIAAALTILRRSTRASWAWVPLKAMDLMATATRLWLAFAVIGKPIDWRDALLVASASMLAGLAAFTPNALGLREWAVAAMTAGMLHAPGAEGALATLVDRAAEAVIFTLIGAPAIYALSRPRQTTG